MVGFWFNVHRKLADVGGPQAHFYLLRRWWMAFMCIGSFGKLFDIMMSEFVFIRNPYQKSVVIAVMDYVDASVPGNDYWNVSYIISLSRLI
jgi:hypothetical protein